MGIAKTRVIIDGWLLTRKGIGMGVYAQRLVAALMRSGTQSDSFCIAIPYGCEDQLTEYVVRDSMLVLPFVRTPSLFIDEMRWQQRLAHWVLRQCPDALLFSPGPFWAVRAPKKTIVTFYDCIYHHFPRYQGRRFIRKWVLKKREEFLKRSVRIVSTSTHAAEEIHQLLGQPKERIETIAAWLPPGYSPSEARACCDSVRKKYGLPSRYWLYVGGYDYRKNVDMLLEAYAAVEGLDGCPPLVLAGRIPCDLSKPVCRVPETISRMKLSDSRIIQPGFIEDEDMPGLYAGAELFIYPSLYEGFGLPPLEAMGCGCPAICSDNSSLPEVVRDRAYRFDSCSVNALHKLLARAVKSPFEVSPQFSAREFDEASAVRQYEALFFDDSLEYR